MTSLANPTKTGYEFAGWWSENGKTSGNWGTQVASIDAAQTGDVTLYAKWSAVEETINVDETTTTTDTTSSKTTKESLAKTSDNLFKVVAVMLAVAAAAFMCASYASRRKSQPKHTKH